MFSLFILSNLICSLVKCVLYSLIVWKLIKNLFTKYAKYAKFYAANVWIKMSGEKVLDFLGYGKKYYLI